MTIVTKTAQLEFLKIAFSTLVLSGKFLEEDWQGEVPDPVSETTLVQINSKDFTTAFELGKLACVEAGKVIESQAVSNYNTVAKENVRLVSELDALTASQGATAADNDKLAKEIKRKDEYILNMSKDAESNAKTIIDLQTQNNEQYKELVQLREGVRTVNSL